MTRWRVRPLGPLRMHQDCIRQWSRASEHPLTALDAFQGPLDDRLQTAIDGEQILFDWRWRSVMQQRLAGPDLDGGRWNANLVTIGVPRQPTWPPDRPPRFGAHERTFHADVPHRFAQALPVRLQQEDIDGLGHAGQ